MSTNEVQVNATKRNVLKYFEKKLMFQYKNESWQNNISNAVGNMLAELNYKAIVETTKEVMTSFEEKYKNHILQPQTDFRTRLKFLFTGKF